jgi:hypothetical protein
MALRPVFCLCLLIYTFDKGEDELSKQLDIARCLIQTGFDDALNGGGPASWLLTALICDCIGPGRDKGDTN